VSQLWLLAQSRLRIYAALKKKQYKNSRPGPAALLSVTAAGGPVNRLPVKPVFTFGIAA